METDRIVLRRWRDTDAESLFKYASDPQVGPMAGWQPHTSVAESGAVIRSVFTNDHTWAIELKETGEAIGCMGYYPYGESNIPIGKSDVEVGYWIARPYWNQGICTEALGLMVDYCREVLHVKKIWSDHFVGNPASGRVMEKCGFVDTGMTNHCSNLYGGDKEEVKIYRFRKKH